MDGLMCLPLREILIHQNQTLKDDVCEVRILQMQGSAGIGGGGEGGRIFVCVSLISLKINQAILRLCLAK